MAFCCIRPLVAFSFLVLSGARAAVFTLRNGCRNTIWPGIQQGAGHPLLLNGGLRLRTNETVSVTAPEGWSGRFWGRRGCSFDSSGKGSCVTGDCGGALECAGVGGAPPVTLAEVTLGSPLDFYDVSLVDGYNLPVSIVASASAAGSSSAGSGPCLRVSCVSDLNRHCPNSLQVRVGGRVVACKSACMAYGSPEFCCTGEYGNPRACRPTNYSRVFKASCPTAYSYAYDDPSSIFTCKGANYLISFC